MEPADKPGSVESSHSSRTCVATSLEQPTRGPHGPCAGFLHAPLFGLALGGVYLATPVASCAVRSYRTLSPLPKLKNLGGLLSVALSMDSHPPGVTWHLAHRARTFLRSTYK